MKNRILIIMLILLTPTLVFAQSKEKAKLVKCIDGDTAIFKIGKEEEKVRFLAINTPEYSRNKKESYGKEASDYTCKKLEKAEKIELEYDPLSEKRDKYGRVLAWVFLDGKLLQEDLVRKGYAEVKYVYKDYLYVEKLERKQEKAIENKIGMWSEKEVEIDEKELIVNYFRGILNKITKKILEKIENML
ncbi:MAG: thermonuclease family protein [Bacilli bacterium]|nr:thermonuclease family protein [Bacilli bacterium]